MKSISVAIAAVAIGSVAATPLLDKPIMPVMSSMRSHQKRQMAASFVNGWLNTKGGKVPDPAGAAPKRAELEARTPEIPGAKTVKLRYGPYKVPNMGFKNSLGDEGALWNYADLAAPKPCEGQCTIVGINAGLEYADGKNANIDTGLWLHHFVLLNGGPGRVDPTCAGSPISLPHMLVGSSATASERFFSSGNERTPAIMPRWNETKVGYMLKPTDRFGLIVDLMNDNMQDAVVYLTITYDYLMGHPEGWDDIQPLWFDIAQCLTSEWPAPYQKGKYTIPSTVWTSTFAGDIVGAAGHLHDGGDRVTLEVDGKVICNSQAGYAEKPEYVSSKAHGGGSTDHVSSMSLCVGDKLLLKKLEVGQKWKLRVDYDYDKNKGSHHGDGAQSNVMGIAIMYVRVPKRGNTVPKAGVTPKATATKTTTPKTTAGKAPGPKGIFGKGTA